jgi:hypothetical protein
LRELGQQVIADDAVLPDVEGGRPALEVIRHHAQRVADVADELELGLVVFVHLGGEVVDVENSFGAEGVPAARRKLDEIVADRDDEVGGFDRALVEVERLQPDCEEAVRVIAVDAAFSHEGG